MRLDSSLFSFVVILAAITGLETPQALPSAAFEATKMYETFYKLAVNGRIRRRSSNEYLFFAQKGKMKQNLQGLRVSGENDNLSYTTVQSLRGCGTKS